jgi:murein DD-endopeptidase MepM/ murein hydrolase activator NlpD
MRLSRASSIAAIVGLVAIAMGWTTTAQADDVQLTPIVQSVMSPPRWYAGDDGRVHLQYELELTNTVPLPVDVVSVEVLGDGQRVELIDGTALLAAMAPLGSAQGETTQLPGSSVAVVWLDLSFDSKRQLPERLRHRLTVDVGEGLPVGPTIVSTGGAARVVRRAPVVIGPPLAGGRWIAVGGAEGPHRRALQAVDGHLRLGQRFAVDFAALLDAEGRSHVGPNDENSSFFAYGQPILAEAGGNEVILDLGDGTFVAYGHFAPGSVQVKAAQRVRRGDVLGKLGNSGNSTGPHLHLQVMNAASFLDADGLPFVIDEFRLDGVVPTLDELLAADTDGTSMPIDNAGAGEQRKRGIVGFDVVTLPGRATTDGEK